MQLGAVLGRRVGLRRGTAWGCAWARHGAAQGCSVGLRRGAAWGYMGGGGMGGGEMGGNGACACACACVSPIAHGGGLPAPPVSPLTVHTDLCTHALLVDLVLVYPLLLCYLSGPPAALSALFTWSPDFLRVSSSLWRPAQCCTHLAPLSHLFVCWALPFGCLVCVHRPASDALMPKGTIALAPAFAHMPGPLATAARVLRRTVDLTHTVTCDHSLSCNWFSALWLALALHRQTLWCPTKPAIWP